jgi:topoisomerase IA-like protein
MEDELDNISTGKNNLATVCGKCYNELTNTLKTVQHLKKFSIVIDDVHTLIIGKNGPVIKCTNKSNPKEVTFLPVKKNLDLDVVKQIGNLSLEDVLEDNYNKSSKREPIGKYKGEDLFVKKGKFGFYAQWGKETKSLKDVVLTEDNVSYIDVIRFLDRDNLLDPTKPVGLVRELNGHLSIRTGKYGDYILYKKPRSTKPEFLKLKDFKEDYTKCDKKVLLDWIKLTYNAS